MKQAFIDLVRDRDRSNRIAIVLVYAMMAAGGSLASVLVVWCAIYILGHLAAGHQELAFERSDRLLVVSCALFASVIAATAVAGGGSGALELFLKLSVYLFPFLLIPGLRRTSGEELMRALAYGSAIGGTVLLAVVLVEYAVTGGRVTGLSGNSGPLSITSLLTAGFALTGYKRSTGRYGDALAILGCVGGITGVMLSGMRGSWPALPVCLLVAALERRHAFANSWRGLTSARRWLIAGSVACAAALAIAVFTPVVVKRYDAMTRDVTLLGTANGDRTSTGRRVSMYEAAVAAFGDRPVFGYGMQNLWPAVRAKSDTLPTFEYNHLHNIVLTLGVGAGIVGIAALVLFVGAPLWVAIATRPRGAGRWRLFCTIILLVAYVTPGMTNIMFLHDILDTVWIFTASLLAASVPRLREDAPR